MFSIVTVASSTRMPTASARPPRVMMLIVSPNADSSAIAARIDSGIEIAMIRVERQLPRNSRIIRLVSTAAMTASRDDAVDRAFHEQRLVAQDRDVDDSPAASRAARRPAP